MATLLTTLTARDLVRDSTPGLPARLEKGPITGYVGFDPTAESLHVGNLVPVMALAWLQRLGGRPLVIVGGGTGMVGDPSGKRAERPMLSPEQVERNAAAMRSQLARFLDFDGPRGAKMFNNAEWLAPVTLLEFLRDTGKHFTIGYMLQKESVKSRLETGISFTEFAYMLVQAHDYEHLFRTQGCELQMGGSDQWGNITAGIELVGRKHGKDVHGLTVPLLTTAAGAKFGKSESGNVWLDPDKTSPGEFYNFWLNQDDRDVQRLLRLFTFWPEEQIVDTMDTHLQSPEKRFAQKALAAEMTHRIHGTTVAVRTEMSAVLVYGDWAGISGEDLLAADIPETIIAATEFGNGMPVVDVLVRTGLATSKADARRGIAGRGFYVWKDPISEQSATLTRQMLRDEGGRSFALLRKGKKKYVRLVVK